MPVELSVLLGASGLRLRGAGGVVVGEFKDSKVAGQLKKNKINKLMLTVRDGAGVHLHNSLVP